MSNRAQIFEAVPFLGDRIGFGIIDPADNGDTGRLDFHCLPLALGFDQFSCHFHGATGRDVKHFGFIIGETARCDGLNRIEAATIVDSQERYARLGIAFTANPPSYRNLAADSQGTGKCLGNGESGHIGPSKKAQAYWIATPPMFAALESGRRRVRGHHLPTKSGHFTCELLKSR